MNLNIVVEAKHMYTNTLVSCLEKTLYTFFKNLWNECKDDYPYETFQSKCKTIHTWTLEQANESLKIILKSLTDKGITKDYLSKLLTTVFKLNIKILNIINEHNVSSINLPSNKTFLLTCIRQACQEFYQQPFIFETRKKKYTNHQLIEMVNKRKSIIKESIHQTINQFLPFEKILCSDTRIIHITHDTESNSHHSDPKHDLNQENKTEESNISIQLIESKEESQPEIQLVNT